MTSTIRIAVIEIGSRAIRLLVADIYANNEIKIVTSNWRQTHLSAVIKAEKSALRKKIDEIASIVKIFYEEGQRLNATKIGVFGTDAIRRMEKEDVRYTLSNIPQLVVLNKKSEALCSLFSAIKGLPRKVSQGGEILTIDQGAGSIELVSGFLSDDKIKLQNFKSYRLGTRTLTELLQKNGGDVFRFQDKIKKKIDQYKFATLKKPRSTIVLGSAATKLAWIKVRTGLSERYDPHRVHGQMIDLKTMDQFTMSAFKNPDAFRKIIDPRNPGGDEFEIVTTGLISLSIFLRKFSVTKFFVSGWGTRHGIAFALANNKLRGVKSVRE